MKKYFSILFVTTILFFASASSVYAANVFIGMDKAEISVNDTVSATVYVDTKGVDINSAEGALSFPKDMLSVESISTSGSVFSIWVEQPNFSNAAGSISFNGGSPNPGFNGSRGAVVRITFRAKKVGTPIISFDSAGIYANDGLGTDVTADKRSASVSIIESAQKVIDKKPVVTTSTVPGAPEINSTDMPDSEKWYSSNKGNFTWNISADVTAARLSLTSSPTAVPTVLYSPAIVNKNITDLESGVSYLNVRLQNANGWGAITRRKIKVDTDAPTDLVVTPSVTADDYVKLSFSAQDKTSGIQSYKVLFNGTLLAQTIGNNGSNNDTAIVLPALPIGAQQLSVRAYDKAGNSTESIVTVEVPNIKAPVIVDYPKIVNQGEDVRIAGTTYSLGYVDVFVQNGKKDPKKYSVQANDSGQFVLKNNTFTSGTYAVWAVAYRGETIRSEESSKVSIQINKSTSSQGTMFGLDLVTINIIFMGISLFFMMTTLFALYKWNLLRKRFKGGFTRPGEESHKIFEVIKEDVVNSLKLFKKLSKRRKVNEEEQETLRVLAKDLEEAEEYFKNRLEK